MQAALLKSEEDRLGYHCGLYLVAITPGTKDNLTDKLLAGREPHQAFPVYHCEIIVMRYFDPSFFDNTFSFLSFFLFPCMYRGFAGLHLPVDDCEGLAERVKSWSCANVPRII